MTLKKKHLVPALLLALATSAFAQEYNRVPAGDQQYQQCISHANRKYQGGTDPSPIRGQNKAQAWCTCLWNETPDDFKGSLVKFSESDRGTRVNKMCEKYSDWSD